MLSWNERKSPFGVCAPSSSSSSIFILSFLLIILLCLFFFFLFLSQYLTSSFCFFLLRLALFLDLLLRYLSFFLSLFIHYFSFFCQLLLVFLVLFLSFFLLLLLSHLFLHRWGSLNVEAVGPRKREGRKINVLICWKVSRIGSKDQLMHQPTLLQLIHWPLLRPRQARSYFFWSCKNKPQVTNQ